MLISGWSSGVCSSDLNPAAVLYLKGEFIAENPETTQALVNALYKALVWLKTAKPEDIVATVPESSYLGVKALYMQAANNSSEARRVGKECVRTCSILWLPFTQKTNRKQHDKYQ